MSVTLADYRAAVTAKGYEAVTTDTAVVAAINAARRRIVNTRRWTFLESTDTSLVTTTGVYTVAVSDAYRIDAVRLTVDNLGSELEYRAPQEIERLVNEDGGLGTPQYWSKRSHNLIFYPTPDAAYGLSIDYVIEVVPALAADGDVETVMEDHLVDAVAWAAAKDLSFRRRDYNAMNFAEAEYQSHLLSAIRDDNTRQRQRSQQVVSNPDRWESY